MHFRRVASTFAQVDLPSLPCPAAVFTMYNRGMGIVSFRSYPFEGYWIRIVKGNLVNKVCVCLSVSVCLCVCVCVCLQSVCSCVYSPVCIGWRAAAQWWLPCNWEPRWLLQFWACECSRPVPKPQGREGLDHVQDRKYWHSRTYLTMYMPWKYTRTYVRTYLLRPVEKEVPANWSTVCGLAPSCQHVQYLPTYLRMYTWYIGEWCTQFWRWSCYEWWPRFGKYVRNTSYVNEKDRCL